MKKLIVFALIIAAVYFALNIITAPQADAPSAPDSAGTQAEEGFRLGVADERVAVYRDGALYLKTETLASSLPKSDRTKLEKGIDVSSVKELKKLLQDYCS